MLGKYDFEEKYIKDILMFYEPILHTISVLLEDEKGELKRNNLLDKEFENMFKFFKNMEFLDQFNEAKDIVNFYYEHFRNKLIVLNKQEIVDRHKFWPNIISLHEMTNLLDKWIKISFDNVKVKKNVLTISECLEDLKNLITDYSKSLKLIEKNLFFNDQIYELLELFNNSYKFKVIENSSEIILSIIEEENIDKDFIHNIFEKDSEEYWNVFNILIRISMLSGFAVHLEELK
ncbi:hypothetical protein [Spiroplasma diminutum]|uniref:Uncharacterized protein n=1 Tax=Spiroplasma diminutum CUAS-1 TaxID=1276221 RepID=S5MJC7_9MOLU|nr:hypothetical protein [Spiroplasma diminutum]AGR42080.1 hypothetical protein SDIMI_v3c03760 [Spiroplasma diminutum CUAS-1]